MGKMTLLVILLCICNLGCSQKKTFVSNELRNVNPYKVGQVLVFISSKGKKDTLTITNVEDGRFADAIGAPQNEHLVVDASRRSRSIHDFTEERILSLLAETESEQEQIDFSLSLKETALNMKYVSLYDFKRRTTSNLVNDYAAYDDVLVFENRANRSMNDRAIVEFYWSKSIGYVRLVQNNGIVWDLKSID